MLLLYNRQQLLVLPHSLLFSDGGQSTNNNSFPQENVTTRVPERMPSFSMPSSLSPSIQGQVRSMHRAFEEKDNNISIASGLSVAHTVTPFPTVDRNVRVASFHSSHSCLTDEDMTKPGCLFHQNTIGLDYWVR